MTVPPRNFKTELKITTKMFHRSSSAKKRGNEIHLQAVDLALLKEK